MNPASTQNPSSQVTVAAGAHQAQIIWFRVLIGPGGSSGSA
jgi:hypothetical protein